MNRAVLTFSLLALTGLLSFSCDSSASIIQGPDVSDPAWQRAQTISYNDISVNVFIDKPEGPVNTVLVAYHGTVWYDSLINGAARNITMAFRRILDQEGILIIGVAYPQQNKLMGDGLREAEAALLWVKHLASEELNLSMERIFIGGHSQGGYIVTRLNTMHETDGVIANAPGPLDFEFRCLLEERGQIAPGRECNLMQAEFGLPSEYPDPYIERSLLSFTEGFKADVLYVQGLNDGPIQMRSWPMFRDAIQRCTNCQYSQIVNIPGAGHDALFSNAQAKGVFNTFIQSRR
ncbi:MAG: hypothetical protein JJU41_03100 [Bacteroidetes bacterium]|nr:hypothetical protein [Bacteroidota bacterium]